MTRSSGLRQRSVCDGGMGQGPGGEKRAAAPDGNGVFTKRWDCSSTRATLTSARLMALLDAGARQGHREDVPRAQKPGDPFEVSEADPMCTTRSEREAARTRSRSDASRLLVLRTCQAVAGRGGLCLRRNSAAAHDRSRRSERSRRPDRAAGVHQRSVIGDSDALEDVPEAPAGQQKPPAPRCTDEALATPPTEP